MLHSFSAKYSGTFGKQFHFVSLLLDFSSGEIETAIMCATPPLSYLRALNIFQISFRDFIGTLQQHCGCTALSARF